jgi:hypothetical protein
MGKQVRTRIAYQSLSDHMDEAARMAVFPLVRILVRGLQVEIGNRMLEHQDGDGSEGEENELWHRRYFDKASAVPSHWGGGGFIRKKAMRSR